MKSESCFERFRVLRKFMAFGAAVICFLLTTLPLYPFYLYRKKLIRPILSRLVTFYCRLACWIFDLDVTGGGQGNSEFSSGSGNLIVANHLSYLDIFCLASQGPMCFVTSVEIKETLFLGQLCQLGGCLFVERRSRSNLKNEIGEIEEALENGENVCIFPEGTSTNGDSVSRFKRPLFQAAIRTKARVFPVTLNYLSLGGSRLNQSNRNNVFWYGEMTFVSHLLNVFRFHYIHVYTTWHSPLSAFNKEADELSLAAHEKVASSFVALVEKRESETEALEKKRKEAFPLQNFSGL